MWDSHGVEASELDGRPRPRRSDAEANRERVVEAAVRIIADEGLRVPVATIAAAAGVGIATFYRSFADRDALIRELESRAYALLNQILDELVSKGYTGVPAIEQFLLRTVQIADRLILPLHGAPPLVDDASVAARQRIDAQLERFLEQGRNAHAVASDVNATDVIMCSALITMPLRHGPATLRSTHRHVALFVAGLASGRPLPGPPVRQADIERAFQAQVAQRGT